MKKLVSMAFAFALLVSATTQAETPEITIKIKDHTFSPAVVELPANQKVKLVIVNEDPTAEEFESDDLKLEKVIAGGQTGVVMVQPVPAGEYKFFGEFNEDKAQGKFVVK